MGSLEFKRKEGRLDFINVESIVPINSIFNTEIMGCNPLLDGKLDVSNWRGFIKPNDEHLILINELSEMYYIFDMTEKVLHEINYCNKTTVPSSFYYLGEALLCTICFGTGVLDWITNINKITKYSSNLRNEYKRNPKASIRKIFLSLKDVEVFLSTPLKSEDQVYCQACKGSGLDLATHEEIDSEYKPENC